MKNADAPALPSTGKFPLGNIVITSNAQGKLSKEDIKRALNRHLQGDWGNIDEDDKAENEFSLKKGFRLLSVYYSVSQERFYIITEGDRSITTILLPEDY